MAESADSKVRIGHHPGATWMKTDLQVHTPRDPAWKKKLDLPGGTAQTEKARNQWAKTFIEACIEKGLRAIAITDHHDVCMVPYVIEAAKKYSSEQNCLWVFPGMEITCNDSAQCLVLFDANIQIQSTRRLFGGILINIEETENIEAKIKGINICGKDLDEIIEAIYSDPIISERCIVLPHGGKDGAHKTVLRKGLHARFQNLKADGIYCEHHISKYDDSDLRIIEGEIDAWGNRRRGIITTGDNRNDAFKDLGINPCWIRLGEPTAEAIRQALLADQARIAYEEPTLPNQRILRLDVSSSLCGNDFSITFNDGFTAIIGGRGSGKSAILEYLRFGLGRSNRDILSRETEAQRVILLLEDTLADGFVKITLERDGVVENWRRTLEGADTIEVEIESGKTETIDIDSAHERFLARAFNQKQLSTLISSYESAQEQITGIAAAEFTKEQQGLDEEIEKTRRHIQRAFHNLSEYLFLEEREKKENARIADLERRRAALSAQLKKEGLSATDQKILESRPMYQNGMRIFEYAEDEVERIIGEINKLKEELFADIDIDDIELNKDFKSIFDINEHIINSKAEIHRLIDDINKEITKLDKYIKKRKNTFDEKIKKFDTRYQRASNQQKRLLKFIESQAAINDEKALAQESIREAKQQLKAHESANKDLANARATLEKLCNDRISILERAANEVTKMSNGVLKASVDERIPPQSMVSALIELGEGANIKTLEARTETQVEEIYTQNQIEGWHELCDQLLSIYRQKVAFLSIEQEEDEDEAPPLEQVEKILFNGLTSHQARKVFQNLDAEKIVQVLTASTEPYIRFEYRDGLEYIPFDRASPGQQAAALLELLLNQEAGTLIIDQPEDDLDNKINMRIAGILQKTKSSRQLIFATHNPNFVVNGDADKVIALTSRGDSENDGGATEGSGPRVSIWSDGAIETRDVRDRITEVMEGGKEAFKLRSRKYHFEDI